VAGGVVVRPGTFCPPSINTGYLDIRFAYLGRSTLFSLLSCIDLLYLNGYDLSKLPLLERKAILRKLIAKTAIQFSESFELDGREMFMGCAQLAYGLIKWPRDVDRPNPAVRFRSSHGSGGIRVNLGWRTVCWKAISTRNSFIARIGLLSTTVGATTPLSLPCPIFPASRGFATHTVFTGRQ
jgi:hypothetical protein